MIVLALDNETLERILSIENCRQHFGNVKVPVALSNKLRKSSKKKSSHASTQIEGNPLTERQSNAAIDSSKRHFLKPEQEVRNYFLALGMMESCLKERHPFTSYLLHSIGRSCAAAPPREAVF